MGVAPGTAACVSVSLSAVLRRLIVVASAVLLLESFFSQVLTPLVPSYRNDLGLGEGATGVLVAAYSVGGLLLAIPGGWFTSRFNPRRAVITGLVGMGLASALFGFASGIVLLDASRFLLGAFGALVWAGGMSWVVSAAPVAQRGRYLGIIMAAAVAGELLGSPVAAMAEEVGTRAVFGVVLVIALGLAALARTIPPLAEADGQGAGTAASIVRAAGRRGFPVVLLAVAGPSVATGLVMVLLPFRFDDQGLSAWWIAGAFLALSVIEVVLGPVAGRLSDRVGRRTPYLAGLALMIAAVAVLGFVTSPAVLIGVMLAFGVGAGLAFTPALAAVADLATDVGLNQGYSSAVSNIGWSASIIIGAAGGGALIAWGGYALAALVAVAVLALIAAVMLRVPFSPR